MVALVVDTMKKLAVKQETVVTQESTEVSIK